MTETPQERLLKWLSDAYAMEKEAETMLSAQAKRIEHYPELRQRIEQHVDETRGQAEAVQGCIERLGGSLPAVKGAAASFMASVHAMGNAMMDDEVIKGSLLSYAFEHLEISVYRTLILAAQEAGDETTRAVCERILTQEQAMADWLATHLEPTVRQFIARKGSEDGTAKR